MNDDERTTACKRPRGCCLGGVIVQESKVMAIVLTFQPTDVLPSHIYYLLGTFPKIYIYKVMKLNEKNDLGLNSLLVRQRGNKNPPNSIQVLFVNVFVCVSKLIPTPPPSLPIPCTS